jgi:hypothetical protein
VSHILGYAVFVQRPTVDGYRTDLVSNVFDDPEQADNARDFCVTKRADPGVIYMLAELRELTRRRAKAG